jgi:hypothetical protein
MQLGECVDFLHPFIWGHDAILQLIRQWVCIKFCASLGKGAAETLAMMRQAFGGESMSHTRMSEWHAWFRADQKRWDRWRAKSRECSLFSLMSRINKEFILAGHTVNSAYYCDVLQRLHEKVWRLHSGLWWRTRCCIMKTCTFSRFRFCHPTNFFTKSYMTAIPPSTLFFFVSLTEDETERPPF